MLRNVRNPDKPEQRATGEKRRSDLRQEGWTIWVNPALTPPGSYAEATLKVPYTANRAKDLAMRRMCLSPTMVINCMPEKLIYEKAN